MKKTLLVLLAGLISITAFAAEPDVKLPGLTVRPGSPPSVEATGNICLTNGILEFIASEKEGRDYESLITLDIKPWAMNTALLLIGCEPGETNGTRLSLDIEWTNAGKTNRIPIEKLLVSRKTEKPPGHLTWTFTGSYFTTNPITGKRVFIADEERAFVALWWQTSVPINLSQESGNPYRGDNEGFEVNTNTVPALGTAIKLILRKQTK